MDDAEDSEEPDLEDADTEDADPLLAIEDAELLLPLLSCEESALPLLASDESALPLLTAEPDTALLACEALTAEDAALCCD